MTVSYTHLDVYKRQDMRFYWERVEASRNFANKVWNASRFIMMNMEKAEIPDEIDLSTLTAADKWILSKAVSYTHLDVYKRQIVDTFGKVLSHSLVVEYICSEDIHD